MSHSFNDNMALAIKHEMRVRELIGRSTVLPSSLTLDKQYGTDLIILSDAAGLGCGARVRRFNEHGRWEFTIRSKASSGGESEYEKFRSGMCRWFFYGVLNEEGTDFCRWMLMDLDARRRAESRRDADGGYPIYGSTRRNADGSSFYVYSATASRLMAQPGFIVDCSDDDFPGHVRVRQFRRQAADVKRFRG